MNEIDSVLLKVKKPDNKIGQVKYSKTVPATMREKAKEFIFAIDREALAPRKKPKVAPTAPVTESVAPRKRPQLSDEAKAMDEKDRMEEMVDIDTEDIAIMDAEGTDDGSSYFDYIEVIDKIIKALKGNTKSITIGYYSFYGGNGTIIGLALQDVSRNITLDASGETIYESEKGGKQKIKKLIKKYFPMNDYEDEDGPFITPESFSTTTLKFDNLTKEQKQSFIKRLNKIKTLQEVNEPK